jgi:hypothetical protein
MQVSESRSKSSHYVFQCECTITCCMKDECALCGRVLSLYSLRRCLRCGKLYCRSCMTTNLWSEQRDLVCLNCARRIVSPKLHGSKYSPLREFLWRQGRYTNLVSLDFSKIEGIINDSLPLDALCNEGWWRNTASTSQGYAWISVGWRVNSVDCKNREVAFQKLGKIETQPASRGRSRSKSERKPFTPIPVKPRRKREPSKTRISKAVARARNIERNRRSAGSIKIKLKPKSAYEKRLYKSDAKPDAHD